MSYRIEYSDDAKKSLLKMKKKNPMEALRIYNWIEKNLVGCDDPRRTGKALTGQYKGSWRYRIGNYRILAEIHDDVLLILLIDIGHRSVVYDRHDQPPRHCRNDRKTESIQDQNRIEDGEKAKELFESIRAQLLSKYPDGMTLDEINAIIDEARRENKEKQ